MKEDVASFENNLFPNFTTKDIVEISGEAGSCKTELLYHLIAGCVFPASWKGIQLDGLESEVMFMDNDCRFNLFRFVSILDNRIKALARASNADIGSSEIYAFIQERLKLLHIIKCYDSSQFITTLSSLGSASCLQKKKTFLMIDSLSSFYWSDKARMQNNLTKLFAHHKTIVNLIQNLSSKCCVPVIYTKRKLLSKADWDNKVLGPQWNSTVTRSLELKFQSSMPDKTLLTVVNGKDSTTKLGSVSKLGFQVLEK